MGRDRGAESRPLSRGAEGALPALHLTTPERAATWLGSWPPPPAGWPGKNWTGRFQPSGWFSVCLRELENVLMQVAGARSCPPGLQRGQRKGVLTSRQICTPGAALGPQGSDPNQRNWPLGCVSSKLIRSKVSLSRGGLRAPEPQSLGPRRAQSLPGPESLSSLGRGGAGVEWPHVQGEIVTDSARKLFSSWSLNSQEKFASPRGSQSAILRLAEGGGSHTPLLSGSPLPCSLRTG